MLELWIDYRLRDVIDIVLVAGIIYFIYFFLFGSKGFQVLKGIVIIVVAYFLGQWLQLNTFIWLFQKVLGVATIALLIIFQSELRQIVTKLGERIKLFGAVSIFEDNKKNPHLSFKLTEIAFNLADRKVGGTIVLGGRTKLDSITEGGIPLDAVISNDLLQAIFNTSSNLHDGACVIEKDRIIAAACLLPLTQQTNLSKVYGTRHLSAIGLSEESDALTIVVSEERGTVSIALDGKLYKNLKRTDLQTMLERFLLDMKRASY